ncbi:MAG: hypothetical protein LBE75_09695 [Burkholderiales bacterium]|jgi:hypothetical protein|nr:hypothetical protein [Burkholderiales bacterium]
MKRALTLMLTVDGERVRALDVRLPRFDATALLRQRPASEAVTLLPLVFSICAQAQAAAAAGAISAARDKPLPPARVAAHTLAVQIESVQESLRSLCLGLPEALLSQQTVQGAALTADFARAWRGGTAFLARLQKALRDEADDTTAALAALHQEAKTVAQTWDAFCARHVYGTSVLLWQGEDGAADEALPVMRRFRQMSEEVPALGRMALSPLPLAMFRAGKLSWQALVEMPYDASGWWRVQQDARMAAVKARFGNSVAARWRARLVDVAKTLAGLLDMEKTATTVEKEETRPWIRAYSLDDGDGIAEVECARGVLVHRAQLAEQSVAAYEVGAPTDWNLHRHGALATLFDLPATDIDRLRTHATWLVQVLDPCVVFELEVVDA